MLKVAKCFKNIVFTRSYVKQSKLEMKYLNVAEKHDAAKTISGLLSNGTASRREGYSVYNKIFDFEATVRGNTSKMVMTSVSGHLLELEFLNLYRNWKNVDPISLFDAPVRKKCGDDYQPIKRTLEREVRGCGGLIIWTDCDREGENIGFEIIEVCRAIKPNIPVYRAIFSEITTAAVRRALQNLRAPDERQNNAVNVRTELDLRTGAALTRFQTMRLQRLFPSKIENKLISYGSCQMPTLGFVVERYKEIEAFVSEPFWRIKVTHTIEDLTVEFNWARTRLFDKQACEDYYLLCVTDSKATVESVSVKPKSKWRPIAMDTIELEKLGSRKLKLSAKETMTIAEKLYTKGFISYPRTETNQFSNEIDLKKLVEQQTAHNIWGSFANRVMEWGPNPRNGTKSDQAHPPIHPTKLGTNLDGNEARVYELICRHFLACVSKDAIGSETIVKIDIAGEKFSATGLCIHERNYLDVYIYDKWNAKQIHNYVQGQTFEPTEISMPEGATTPPALLTEADLIAIMEKNGIGTDATHADHINTIKERGYIGVVDNGFLVPGVIGMGLYEGYEAMQLALTKPALRAEFEADLKKICLGEKDPQIVLREQIVKYKETYKQIMEKVIAMDEKMGIRLNETPTASDATDASNVQFENKFHEIFQCPKCNVAQMALKPLKNQSGHMIGCLNYPDCKNVIWWPAECHDPSVLDETCRNCGSDFKMIKFKFSTVSYKALFNAPAGWYKTCLRCDSKFRETFNINLDCVKRVGAIVDVRANTNTASTTSRERTTNIGSSRTGTSTAPLNFGASSSTNVPRQGNKRKDPGNEDRNSQTKRTKKTNTKSSKAKTTTQTTNSSIRSFTTNARNNLYSGTTTTSSELNNIDEFFNSNDSFDTLMLGAESIQMVDTASNRTSAYRNNNELENDIIAAFEDDDVGDWNIDNSVVRSASNLNNNTFSRPQNNFNNDMDDSISAMFRTEIDYDNFTWGTGNRSERRDSEELRNKNKTARSQETIPLTWGTTPSTSTTSITANSSPNENKFDSYSWGSASKVNVISHGIKCTGCHQEAKELCVKKDGPNKGRIFYVCPKENQCNFFQWADEQSSAANSSENRNRTNESSTAQMRSNNDDWGSSQGSRDSYSWGTTSQPPRSQNSERSFSATSTADIVSSTLSSEVVNCNCGVPASSLTVRKDGPNKGRPFHGCIQRNCNFFQWGDADNNQASAPSTSNQNMAWGTGSVRNNSVNSTNSERESKKRKCGLCRQEGHTKQKCPRKSEFDQFFK